MTTLHGYQKEAIAKINQTAEGLIVGLDTGLGKTITTLEYISSIIKDNDIAKFILVVKSSNINDPWIKTLESDDYSHIKFVNYSGLITDRKIHQYENDENEKHIGIGDANILLTTYDILKNDIEFLQKTDFYAVIFDEFHNYINKKGDINVFQTFKKVFDKNIKKIVLTASPIKNHKDELFNIFEFITCESYNNEKSDSLLSELCNKYAYFLSKENVQQNMLPPLTSIKMHINLSSKHIEDYTLDADMNNNKLKNNLYSISCPKGTIHHAYKNSNKANAIVALIKMIPKNHKIVVFSLYTNVLHVIGDGLTNASIKYVTLTGEDSQQMRNKQLEMFKNSSKIDVLLATIGAGGEGLNLQYSNYVILHDSWWNPQKIKQAIDRVHRQGQRKAVAVFRFISDYDLRVEEISTPKMDLSDNIFNIKNRSAETQLDIKNETFYYSDDIQTKIMSYINLIDNYTYPIGEKLSELIDESNECGDDQTWLEYYTENLNKNHDILVKGINDLFESFNELF